VNRQRERAIRELAYRLWKARGCGDGRAVEDWLDAERLLGEYPTDPEPPLPAANSPEGEVADVMAETPKVGSRDAPGG
jgi:hypothetical protein